MKHHEIMKHLVDRASKLENELRRAQTQKARQHNPIASLLAQPTHLSLRKYCQGQVIRGNTTLGTRFRQLKDQTINESRFPSKVRDYGKWNPNSNHLKLW